MSSGPNALAALWSIVRARRVSTPDPRGTVAADHRTLVPILSAVSERRIAGIADVRPELDAYLESQSNVVPDHLSRGGALAFWINLYNAQTLAVVDEADSIGADSVLRIPGVFTQKRITIAGEQLSLDDIEHGKIRRFGDPRIHSALVCGSVSCPTLRSTPFSGTTVDIELDDQMRQFLRGGGAEFDSDRNRLTLSRVFKWYGRDFTHPSRMPTLLPASNPAVAEALTSWLDEPARSTVTAGKTTIAFAEYDWKIGCSVG